MPTKKEITIEDIFKLVCEKRKKYVFWRTGYAFDIDVKLIPEEAQLGYQIKLTLTMFDTRAGFNASMSKTFILKDASKLSKYYGEIKEYLNHQDDSIWSFIDYD